jgi:hypothetical protein
MSMSPTYTVLPATMMASNFTYSRTEEGWWEG